MAQGIRKVPGSIAYVLNTFPDKSFGCRAKEVSNIKHNGKTLWAFLHCVLCDHCHSKPTDFVSVNVSCYHSKTFCSQKGGALESWLYVRLIVIYWRVTPNSYCSRAGDSSRLAAFCMLLLGTGITACHVLQTKQAGEHHNKESLQVQVYSKCIPDIRTLLGIPMPEQHLEGSLEIPEQGPHLSMGLGSSFAEFMCRCV